MLKRLLVLMMVLLGASGAARAAEPEALALILDLIAAKSGVRPTYGKLEVSANGVVTLTNVALSVKNPAEPDDRNETHAKQIILRGLSTDQGVVTVRGAEITGFTHQRSVFSMEVLQIDSMFAELGVDPPGSIGRAVDDKISIGELSASVWTLDTQAAMTGDGKALIAAMGVENMHAKDLSLLSSGTPLKAAGFSMELQRRRSSGPNGRHYEIEDLVLTAPILQALFGTAPAELGYSNLTVNADAQTSFEATQAQGSASVKADGAGDLHFIWDLSDVDISQLVIGSNLRNVIAASPQARVEIARGRYVDRGAAARMMVLLERQTGASRAQLAGALAAQAASEMRRAGFRRVAGETETALAELLGNGRDLVLALSGAPLASLAGADAAGLEKAGLTVKNGR